MKKWYAALFAFFALWLLSASGNSNAFDTDSIQRAYVADVKNLNMAADSLWLAVCDSNLNSESVVDAFHRCRYWYKRSEAFTEYFYPGTAKLLNGPPIQEAELESGIPKIVQPEGLQVIAEFVYADSSNPLSRRDFVQAVWRFISACRWLEKLSLKQQMSDWQIMDALKLEVVRMITLGITGFDTPVSANTIQEQHVAIDGIHYYLQAVLLEIENHNSEVAHELLRSLIRGEKYLEDHSEFDSFDRMVFIRDFANPLYADLIRSCDTLQIQWPKTPTAIRRTAKNIFEKDAMDPWFYARDNRPELQRIEVAELGKLLFFDPVLSGDRERACASCHRPELGFSDGKPTSLGFSGSTSLKRNSPTLLNVAFQATYFFDGRVNFLEDQIRRVVNNTNELHGNFSFSISILKKSKEYRALFANAFRGSRDTAISTNAIVSAISAYERTLVSNNSRFDKHIRGEGKVMSKAELRGFNLFMGKAQCATCHFLPMFSGTFPPAYIKSEMEIIGVPQFSDTTNTTVDSDFGRLMYTGLELHRFAFKTPTIRNVELTAPYMHNGVFQTLREVVDFYNKGGASGAGENFPSQTLDAAPLQLSNGEVDDLVKFLECLSDTTGLTSRPNRLPTIDDDEMNNRKIGGSY